MMELLVSRNTKVTQVNTILSEIIVDLWQLIKIKGNNMAYNKDGKWVYDTPSEGLAQSISSPTNYGIIDYAKIDPSAVMASQVNDLNTNSLNTLNSNHKLESLGINPDTFADDYIKGMSIGGDGKIYNSDITEQTNQALAEKGVLAGPTQQNANLLNGGSDDWGYKEWGTAGNLGLGAGQLGLGIASYFENKKTADAQRKLLGQQYESNANLMADRKANQSALAKINIK